MNHIFEITNNELFQFASSFNFMIGILEVSSPTVDDICHNLQAAFSDIQSMFPQDGPYKALAFISTKHQCFMDDISQIQGTFSELPDIEITHCDLKTYCDDLDDDEQYKIRLLIGDKKNSDQQFVDSLIKRALDNDEDAICLLGCDPESYSGIITFGESSLEPFNTEYHIYRLFHESAGSVSHLIALAVAFFHGIIVEKDQRMAQILLDCALKAKALFTYEELQERDCWLDPDAVQYYFLSDDPADRLYVLDWIEHQSHTDSIFQSFCAWLMTFYDRSKIGS